MTETIAFIGAGNMAEAIARGLHRTTIFSSKQLVAADPSAERRAIFQDELGIRAVASASEAADGASTILLCVKPQKAREALSSIASRVTANSLIISIAAGVTSALIEKHLTSSANPSPRVVRTMPNAPMLVGAGVVAMSAGTHATADDLNRTRALFESCATVIELDESLLDAVTAVSGSGPAYFFYLTEQIAAAGVANGLTEKQAAQLARQTAVGAAKMLADSADSPSLLRQRVTSPNGTTQAAIEKMKAMNFEQMIRDALTAAAHRSKALSEELNR